VAPEVALVVDEVMELVAHTTFVVDARNTEPLMLVAAVTVPVEDITGTAACCAQAELVRMMVTILLAPAGRL
jgi:hypothetical protein